MDSNHRSGIQSPHPQHEPPPPEGSPIAVADGSRVALARDLDQPYERVAEDRGRLADLSAIEREGRWATGRMAEIERAIRSDPRSTASQIAFLDRAPGAP